MTAATQLQVAARQQVAANRLLKIETLRVREGIDEPSALMRAKLLVARARLWNMRLSVADHELRRRLSSLLDLKEQDIVISPDAPRLPALLPLSARGEQDMVSQELSARDVAQFEYALARLNRRRKEIKAAQGKSGIGDLISAYVEELERMGALLEIQSRCLRAEVQFLFARGELINWATSVGSADVKNTLEAPASTSNTVISRNVPLPASEEPEIRSILVTPAISSVRVGDSRQLSVIVVYSNGRSKDATREAIWNCSSDFRAIISTTGMLTGIYEGQVAISVTVGGKTQSHLILIEPDDSSPLGAN